MGRFCPSSYTMNYASLSTLKSICHIAYKRMRLVDPICELLKTIISNIDVHPCSSSFTSTIKLRSSCSLFITATTPCCCIIRGGRSLRDSGLFSHDDCLVNRNKLIFVRLRQLQKTYGIALGAVVAFCLTKSGTTAYDLRSKNLSVYYVDEVFSRFAEHVLEG
ncbi:unnamed protein product [Amoebophrya sp. A25]|nr:unnamed protein product [Amoebophrya sp. A25]|eukprot:GSA25T00006209001.1